MADSYDVPPVKAKLAKAVPVSGYPLSDQDRIDGLHNLLERTLHERDYQTLAEVAGLAHRYNQLAHIIYRVDDIIANGPRRHRR